MSGGNRALGIVGHRKGGLLLHGDDAVWLTLVRCQDDLELDIFGHGTSPGVVVGVPIMVGTVPSRLWVSPNVVWKEPSMVGVLLSIVGVPAWTVGGAAITAGVALGTAVVPSACSVQATDLGGSRERE